MSHGCSTLVLHCIDYRFGKAKKQYLEEKGLLGDCDIVAIAGAAKNIASPSEPSDTEMILRQVDIAQRLHGISNVVVINHTDCGAYGGKSAFASRDEEHAFHQSELEKASSHIVARFPALKVTKVLAELHDSGEITFHE
ncbi:MAG: hypothetical protein QG633_140 [Patescibacteria group bacterium]|jgi:carbonic anhydrase|nr:hypothetical protein [Patescibacteria group bacterium]